MLHHKPRSEGRMSKVPRGSTNHPKLFQRNKARMKHPQVKKTKQRIWDRLKVLTQ